MTKINYQDQWQFAADAFNGTGIFYDMSAIDKFGREDDEDYTDRKDISKNEYKNLFKSKVSKYTGHLFKDTPMRETDNELVKTIFADADRTGSTIDVFMQAFSDNAKARGVNVCLVDMPAETANDLTDQIERRITPFFVEILPENITSYKINAYGRFEYIAYADIVDNSTFEDEDIVAVVRYWDAQVWKVLDDRGNTLEEGEHGLGICPVEIFSESGNFQTTGEFYQLAGQSKKILNLESEEKNLMRNQSFSLLTAQKTDGSNPDLEVGTNNVLFYTGDHQPNYISSDASQAGTYEKKLLTVINDMNSISYDEPESSQAESGLSKAIRFQGLNSSLAKFANRMENTERNLFLLVSMYLGLPLDVVTINYNMDFNINDLNEEVATLDAVNSIADLPLYRAAALKKIISLSLPSLSEEELEPMYLEIDNNSKEAEVIDEVIIDQE